MKQTKLITFTILSILIFSSTSFAMWGQHHNNYRYGYGMRQMQQLTADEQKALKKARLEFIKDIRPIKTKIFNARLDLETALASENPNPAKVRELRKTIQASIKKLQEKKRLQFKKINEIVPGFKGMGRHQMRFTTRYQCPPLENDPI